MACAGAPKNSKGQKAGDSPPDRAGHSITRLANGNLLVFGGMDNSGGFYNDLWEIDLQQLHWFSLLGIAKGAPPKPRAYHSCAPLICWGLEAWLPGRRVGLSEQCVLLGPRNSL